SWRAAIAVWSVPVIVIAALTLALAPRRVASPLTARERVPWWPDWRDPLVWKLGVILASVNSIYFATNGFLPGYLRSVGRSDLISAALTAFNFGQLPASVLLLFVAGRVERRAWPYVVSMLLALTALAGLV